MKKEIIELTKNLNVLFVDDDETIREQINNLFPIFFKSTDIAKNGEEALEYLKKNEYDIIFSDIEMPKINGLELLKKIKSVNPSQKFILITAYSRCDYIYKAIQSGTDGFLVKPLELEKFLSLLKRVATIIKNEKLSKEFNKQLQKKLNEKIKEIEFKTYYDELTKLKNRNALLKEIKNRDFLILLNINDFSSINVVYGYEKGDEVLKYIAKKIKKFKDVYYLGNDEFAILKKIDINEIDIPPFKIDENQFITINFTVGIAKGDNLLKKAYLALKEAKTKSKKAVIYSKNLEIEQFHQKVQKYMPVLKKALQTDNVIPFFQGIYDNKAKKITKYEVLARIKNGSEIISPFFFIDIAEKGGFIVEITKKIIDKSFKIFSKNDYEFSINLTEIDLMSEELTDYLIKKTEEYKIKKERVILEILEGIGKIDNSIILNKLKALKESGFKIAIDDFGTMNSNFERFTLFKADYLKIDGKFIKNITTDKNSYAITKTIASFAKSINTKIIAEFVSNEEIQNIVEKLGIDYSQGYLFSTPKEDIK